MTRLAPLAPLILWCNLVTGQPGTHFWPNHIGDTWQYRSVFTGQVIRTPYIDSISSPLPSGDKIIYYRGGPRYRIDSLGNLFNMDFHAEFPRYKLYTDSGASWIAGYDIINGDTLRTFRISVSNIYQRIVFGIPTTAKVFRFDMIRCVAFAHRSILLQVDRW